MSVQLLLLLGWAPPCLAEGRAVALGHKLLELVVGLALLAAGVVELEESGDDLAPLLLGHLLPVEGGKVAEVGVQGVGQNLVKILRDGEADGSDGGGVRHNESMW